jgi:hypothetical protein
MFVHRMRSNAVPCICLNQLFIQFSQSNSGHQIDRFFYYATREVRGGMAGGIDTQMTEIIYNEQACDCPINFT